MVKGKSDIEPTETPFASPDSNPLCAVPSPTIILLVACTPFEIVKNFLALFGGN